MYEKNYNYKLNSLFILIFKYCLFFNLESKSTLNQNQLSMKVFFILSKNSKTKKFFIENRNVIFKCGAINILYFFSL